FGFKDRQLEKATAEARVKLARFAPGERSSRKPQIRENLCSDQCQSGTPNLGQKICDPSCRIWWRKSQPGTFCRICDAGGTRSTLANSPGCHRAEWSEHR